MLWRFALASVVFLVSCAPTPPPASRAPEASVDHTPPIPPPPALAKSVEAKPALSLEPLVAGDVARWKITNHTPEPLQLGIEHAQQYWARDCRSPLQRIDNDGRARCMPIHVETDVAAYAKLDPGASAVITLSLQFDSRGPEPALPAGRYQLAITTTNPSDRSSGPTARASFRLEGLDEDEARPLAQRIAFATEHGCAQTSEFGQRALAWTAPEAIALSAMDAPGVPWMRARYAKFLVMLPEAQERLRSALRGSSFDTAVAINALLSARTQPPTEVREEALRALPSALGVSGFDPHLAQAAHNSDHPPSRGQWRCCGKQSPSCRVARIVPRGRRAWPVGSGPCMCDSATRRRTAFCRPDSCFSLTRTEGETRARRSAPRPSRRIRGAAARTTKRA